MLSLYLSTVLLITIVPSSLCCSESSAPITRKYRLCTYSSTAFETCSQISNAAVDLLLDLPLDCVRKYSKERCIELVSENKADMVILTEHQYQTARNGELKPVIYESGPVSDVYIAVASKNISLVDINEALIIVNKSDGRAFHAAAFFNLQRGHDICRFVNKPRIEVYVYIINSADYLANDNEILLCPDHTWSTDYSNCNFEAGLQTAVFMRRDVASYVISDVKQRVFDTILENFGPVSQQDVIAGGGDGDSAFLDQFKNTATGFDLVPTYRNGVNESVFNHLHCYSEWSAHDPSIVEA